MGSQLDKEFAKFNPQATEPVDLNAEFDSFEVGPNGPITAPKIPDNRADAVIQGVGDVFKEAGSNALALVKDPMRAVNAVKEGLPDALSATGDMFKHPLDAAKMIIWDGMVQPLLINPLQIAFDDSLTPEQVYQKSRDMAVGYAGFGTGYGLGRATVALGKMSSAASAVRKLALASKMEEVVEGAAAVAGDGSTAVVGKAILDAEKHTLPRLIAGWTVGGFAEGVTSGFLGANNPEDAVKNALTEGFMESLLGVGIGVGHFGLSKGKKVVVDKVHREQWKQLVDSEKHDLAKFGGLHAVADLMEGTDFVRVMSKWLPEGTTKIYENVPEGSFDSANLPENAHAVKNKDGSYRILIAGNDFGKIELEDTSVEGKTDEKVEINQEVVDQLTSAMAVTGEGQVGAKMDPSLLKKLGANMYKSGLVKVIVKEGVQNAVDALRNLSGQIDPNGILKLVINSDKRTISFDDNGVGMSPEVAANQFMDVGGSFKQGASAGGYGLAKVGLLANAEHFKMVTVHKGTDGKKRMTIIEGSADDWAAGSLRYEHDLVDDSTPTGTKLAIKLEKDVNFDEWEAGRAVENTIKWSRDFTIDYKNRFGTASHITRQPANVVDISNNHNANVTFLHSPNNMERQGGWDTLPVHVLNRGVYQFTTEVKVKGVTPEYVIADVGSNVGVDDTDYPFTTSREELKSGIDTVVQEYVGNIARDAAIKNAQKLVESVSLAPRIPGSALQVVDTSMRATPEQLMKVVNAKSTKILAETYATVLKRVGVILQLASSRVSPESILKFTSFDAGGIALSKDYFGVNISGTSLRTIAADAGIDARGIPPNNIIYVNPFVTFQHALAIDAVEPGVNGQIEDILASHSIGTLIHEVTHEAVREHNEAFAGALTRTIGIFMTLEGVGLKEALRQAWIKALNDPSFHSNFDLLKDEVWTQEPSDAFKSITVHDASTPGSNADGGSIERSDETGSKPKESKANPIERRTTGDESKADLRTGKDRRKSSDPIMGRDPRQLKVEEWVKHWKDHGYLPQQVVMYKGGEYYIAGKDRGNYILKSLTDPTVSKRVSPKSVVVPNTISVAVDTKGDVSKIALPITTKDFNSEMNNRALSEAVKESPEDFEIYKRNQASLDATRARKLDKAVSSVAEYGMHFRNIGDTIQIINEHGRVIHEVDTLEEAIEFSKSAASISPTDLVPNIPGGPTIGAFEGEIEPSKIPDKYGWIEKMRDEFNQNASWLSTPYAFFNTISRRYGKDFFNNLFLPLQKARMKYQAALKPWSDRINASLAPMAKYTSEQRQHLFNALGAVSADELLSNEPSILQRALNDSEKRLGQELSKNSTVADRDMVYKYLLGEKQLQDNVKYGKMKPEELDGALAQLYGELTDNQKQVHQIFKTILGERMQNNSLFAINELADAINNNSLDREAYIKTHGVDRKLVDAIDKIYQELAPTFGISGPRRLNRYITHMWKRNYGVKDGGLLIFDKNIRASDVDFAYGLPRTGAHKDLLTDPAEILSRYVMHGMKTQHLYPEVAKTINWLKDSITGIDGRAAEFLVRRSMDYINEIRGFKNNEDAYVMAGEMRHTEEALGRMMGKMGLDQVASKDWIRTYLKISEIATQGFKPIAGVRDAASFLMHYYVRYGTKRTARMIRMASAAFKNRESLESAGKIPTLTVEFYNTLEQLEGKGQFLDKYAEQGFKYSGQPVVFAMSHAMTFLESKATVSEALTKLVNKKMDRKAFDKAIDLESFEKPVVDQFNNLLDKGKYLEAVDYLADINGREIVGYYGIANHPFFMQSRIGKVLGQHGQWPLWMLQNFGRMAARGGKAKRLGTWIKVGALVGAMGATADELDLDLRNWYLDPTNAIFAGGPVLQTIYNGMLAISDYGPNAEFGQNQLKRMVDFSRPQFYVPIPSQAYNVVEAWQRAGRGDPISVVGGRLLGIRASADYPK